MREEGDMLIINAVPDTVREIRGGGSAANLSMVSLAEMSRGMHELIDEIARLLAGVDGVWGEFALDEVEFTAAITSSGKFALLGFGAEAGIKGGLSFKVRRRTHGQSTD